MPFYPLDIPDGCFRNGTEYQSQGRWYDMAGIRFFNKTRRPVGGWHRIFDTPLDGPGRGMLSWRRNTGVVYCAVGTPNKLWIFDNDVLTDVTPDFFATGVLDTVVGTGFGSGPFGAGPFGAGGAAGSRSNATTWSLAAWGENLLAMASHDNVLYEWDGTLASKATPVADAPTGAAMFVTQEQIAVILGADDDGRDVKWSDVQILNFVPDTDNLAGEHKLVTDGTIVTGFPVRGGNLILTTADAHFMEYVGPQQVYRFTRIDTGCGVVGVRAATSFQNGSAVWMGEGQFFFFDGAAVRPLPCDVADYVFGDIDGAQAAKVYCSTTQQFGEITWFYPSQDSLTIDRSVTWNFLDNTWAINGQPPRTSWQDAGAFEFPLAVDESGYLYTQEDGWTNNGASRVGEIFLRSGPVEIGNGDNVIYVTKIVPDEITGGMWSVRFKTRFSPENTQWDFGPYTLTAFTDARLAGRQVAVELRNVADGDSRIGRFRFEGKPGGRR